MLKRELALAIALACAAPAAFALEKITPAEVPAGEPFEIEFKVPADALAVTVAARETPCTLIDGGFRARCLSPSRIAPGNYAVYIDTTWAGRRRNWHAILTVRMPRLWGVAPRSAPPGARIRLDLDSRMPEEAEPKVFFEDHWGVREARVLEVWRSRIEVEVPLRASPGPLSEIWIEVGDVRSTRVKGFRVVAAPEAPWRSFLPATFGAGLALCAAAGLLGALRARRQRAPAKALERGPLKDYKGPRAGRS